ncbi:MAG TPA: hypothetical protein VJZ00_05245 [Thermoanaerobaculia bacterium]|nr:hypothetical protein [Thermoanaerobaculia bacterium]
MNREARDIDSTLIRRGVNASTFHEMEQFAETIEERPLDKLLTELPGIAQLSGAKFDLARQVVRRRANHLIAVEREQLRVMAEEVASGAGDDVAQRIRGIFG